MARYDVRKAAYYLEQKRGYMVVLSSDSPRVWTVSGKDDVLDFLSDDELIDLASNWGWRGI